MMSGVDGLPHTWCDAKLSEITSVNPTLDKVRISDDLDISLVPMPAVQAESGVINIGGIRKFSEVKKGYTPFREGDVLFAKITPCMENGKMAVVPEVRNGIGFGSTEFHVLRAQSGVNAKYVYYYVSSQAFRREAEHNMSGAVGQRRVTTPYLSACEVPLPPTNEQHRIVAKIEELLSELDKGIENLKTARAQLKVYRQALLKHAFEGKLTAQWRAEHFVIPAKAGIQPLNDMDSRLRGNDKPLKTADDLLKRIQQERAQRYQQQLADWEASGKQGSKPKAPKPLPPLTAEELAELPELPEGWGHIQVGNLLDVVSGNTPKGIETTKGTEIPYYRVSDMNRDGNEVSMNSSATYLSENEAAEIGLNIHPDGTIIFPKRGGAIATNKKRRLAHGSCFDLNLMGLANLPNSLNADYLWLWVLALDLASISDGSNVPQINNRNVEPLAFPICSFEEQALIVELAETRLSEADQLDQTLTTALQQAEALRQSILKKAFSGQLVAQDANDESASVLLARIKAEKAAQAIMAKPRKPLKAQVQAAPAKPNVIPFPVKIGNISATDLHAGILARAYRLHEQDPKRLAYFGHVKAEKIGHLVEAHLGIDLERVPFKDAAGPNDYPHLKKVESRAQKANWFDVLQQKKGGAYVFNKKHGFDALLDKTANALGKRVAEVDALLQLLLPLNTRQAEIVATLYAAWNNLLLLGRSPQDEDIVYEARENWHESKLNIDREKFFKGLEWMRKQGLVPAGRGRYVSGKGKRKTTRKSV